MKTEAGGAGGSATARVAAGEMALLAQAGEPAPPAPAGAATDEASLSPADIRTDRRYITAALMLVMVLASMEQTVTSTAMPTIIGDLQGLEHYSWVTSIYLLACTVSMPLYGRLADVLGRKKVVVAAIVLFCVASVFAGMSRTLIQLIVYRGMQGLGAGGIMPVVLTILGDIFTLEERPRVQGFFSAVWGTASLAGPALGALLIHKLGWRSIFYVNLPFGAIGLFVLLWKYHDREKPHTTDLDLPGVLTLAGACGAALALVSGLGPDGWSEPVALALLAAAIGGTLAFVKIEKNAANPVLPPDLIMKRAIGPSLAASLLLGVGFLSLDTYVPLYVQGAHGGGAGAAATVVTPVMLTWALSGIFAAPLVVRWGFRRTAMLGCALIIIGFVGLYVCAVRGAPHAVLTAILALTGFGFGPASMAYLLAAQDAVTWQQRGIITSGIQFFRTVGGAIGIGLLGMMFNYRIHGEIQHLRTLGVNPADLMDPHKRAGLSDTTLHTASTMIASGLTAVFAAMVICAVVQALATAMLSGKKVKELAESDEWALGASA